MKCLILNSWTTDLVHRFSYENQSTVQLIWSLDHATLKGCGMYRDEDGTRPTLVGWTKGTTPPLGVVLGPWSVLSAHTTQPIWGKEESSRSKYMHNKITRRFGPFLEIPSDLITPAGFDCMHCKRSVEKLLWPMPDQIVRAVLYNCRCGTVFVWEDEKQPAGSKHWSKNIRLLRASKTDLLIFNGNKPLQPDFSGLS